MDNLPTSTRIHIAGWSERTVVAVGVVHIIDSNKDTQSTNQRQMTFGLDPEQLGYVFLEKARVGETYFSIL